MSPPKPIPLAIVAVALLAWTLPGCGSGSDNGVASKTAQQILAASKAAIQNAGSVTIKSKGAQGRLSVDNVELHLAQHDGQGNVTLLGTSFQMIRMGSTIYVKGGPEFYEQLGITHSVPQGRWVKAPATGSLGAFTDLAQETSMLISTRQITKGKRTRVDDQPVIELKIKGQLYTGRLYIKTTGEPYPLELEKTGEETAHTTFTDWNKAVTVKPPANATDITALMSKPGGRRRVDQPASTEPPPNPSSLPSGSR